MGGGGGGGIAPSNCYVDCLTDYQLSKSSWCIDTRFLLQGTCFTSIDAACATRAQRTRAMKGPISLSVNAWLDEQVEVHKIGSDLPVPEATILEPLRVSFYSSKNVGASETQWWKVGKEGRVGHA